MQDQLKEMIVKNGTESTLISLCCALSELKDDKRVADYERADFAIEADKLDKFILSNQFSD